MLGRPDIADLELKFQTAEGCLMGGGELVARSRFTSHSGGASNLRQGDSAAASQRDSSNGLLLVGKVVVLC